MTADGCGGSAAVSAADVGHWRVRAGTVLVMDLDMTGQQWTWPSVDGVGPWHKTVSAVGLAAGWDGRQPATSRTSLTTSKTSSHLTISTEFWRPVEDLKARALVKYSCTSLDLQDKTTRRSVEDLKAKASTKNRKTLKICDCRQEKALTFL